METTDEQEYQNWDKTVLHGHEYERDIEYYKLTTFAFKNATDALDFGDETDKLFQSQILRFIS